MLGVAGDDDEEKATEGAKKEVEGGRQKSR